METASLPRRQGKVVFVLGPTGSGKSKLAITLATQFNGEVVNSDKMQVYDGLDVISNKVTEEESAGIPHHLIGGVHPDADFTASDFCRAAMHAIDSILRRGRVPIVAGGSNSYIEALVDGEGSEFRSRYESCFVWIDVDLPLLHFFVSIRVDKMVEQGLVEEARSAFRQDGDYSKGIRRSIGVPEMDSYFRMEASVGEATRARMLEAAVTEIKFNTCTLTCNQLKKIHRFCTLPGWDVHRIDATEFFLKRGQEGEAEAWEKVVEGPSKEIVQRFLSGAIEVKDGVKQSNGASGAVPRNQAKYVKGESKAVANGIKTNGVV
ncbi:adenylate isopentenyltransferase 5, chloroplastic-like [Phoenix dactylifera]|uniref:adenylate dimethylallyltransferase (ADP/ATP-dependent) n=1 Tax=Phoenix dactylifera TaxID=42345 RepID=A0A8B8ZJF3_PHODC|nr:adenylate isopentenyltransferase 5, chloroplastic-like [Phoenix dactylifera]XP_038971835.1 adenylate isopentenyltransferase 5, chloroplastic-like [Phoenix dactylifera]